MEEVEDEEQEDEVATGCNSNKANDGRRPPRASSSRKTEEKVGGGWGVLRGGDVFSDAAG